MVRRTRRPSSQKSSCKQDRRQLLSSLDGSLIGRAPRIEELDQLLSCTVIVPFAVTPDDFKQMVGGLIAFAARIERGRKLKPCLMIERIRGDFPFEIGQRPKRLGLLGQIDRGLYGPDRRIAALRF